MRRSALAALVAAALVLGALAAAPAATGDAPATGPDTISLVRVGTPTRADRQRLADLGVDLSEHAGSGFVDVVLHGAADAARLRDAGFTWSVRIPDLVAREAEIAALDAAYAASSDSQAMPSGRRAYRSLADYEWDLRELAKRNPDLVKLIRLPHATNEGRAVYAVEVTRDVATTGDGKPVFALLGLHHAREWPSGEHTIEFAFDLVRSVRAGNPRMVDLLGRARVLVVPVVNPDGFVASFEAAQVIDGNEVQEIEGARGDESLLYTAAQAAVVPAYKRKNCRMVDGEATTQGTCTAPGARQLGVDPNRNYAGLWGGAGASAFPADDIYRGATPFSEPETQNVRDAIASRQVTMMVSNHTFAGLVLRPPGVHQHGVTVDEPALRALGERMAAANGAVNQSGYELYDTTGTTEDWSYGATGGFGYTFEIDVEEFHPPYAETVESYLGTEPRSGNREAFVIALEAAADPAHHSVIAADAPAGAVLRLHKRFDTLTSPVRATETQFTDEVAGTGDALRFTETLDSTLVAPGHVEWHVNPSTRPAVMERRVYGVEAEPVATREMEGTTPAFGEHVDVPFTLEAAAAGGVLEVNLQWDGADDLDLVVYRRVGGELREVGSSGAPPTFKETAIVEDAVAGSYVLRVVNAGSVAPSFTLTTAAYRLGVVDVHPALVPFETWTLTCERPDGRVLQAVDVLVSRGDRVEIDLAPCRAAWPGERPL